MIYSTSTIKSGSNVKFGGTGMVMDSNWSSRIIVKGQDPSGMGRWSFVKLLGKERKELLLVTANRVGTMEVKNAGSKTSLMQQYALLRGRGLKNPDPRTQLVRDLKGWIKKIVVLRQL